jgi:hypothetical protein
MDAYTLERLKKLSNTAKETLIQICLVYPDTESISSDINRAITLKTIVKYNDLGKDLDRIIAEMDANPRFLQLQSKDICFEILRSMTLLGEQNSILNNVDFIIFQRIKIPVLCLENTSASLKVGVSAFIELSEVRIKVHRMVDWNGPSLQTIMAACAILIATAAFFRK